MDTFFTITWFPSQFRKSKQNTDFQNRMENLKFGKVVVVSMLHLHKTITIRRKFTHFSQVDADFQNKECALNNALGFSILGKRNCLNKNSLNYGLKYSFEFLTKLTYSGSLNQKTCKHCKSYGLQKPTLCANILAKTVQTNYGSDVLFDYISWLRI